MRFQLICTRGSYMQKGDVEFVLGCTLRAFSTLRWSHFSQSVSFDWCSNRYAWYYPQNVNAKNWCRTCTWLYTTCISEALIIDCIGLVLKSIGTLRNYVQKGDVHIALGCTRHMFSRQGWRLFQRLIFCWSYLTCIVLLCSRPLTGVTLSIRRSYLYGQAWSSKLDIIPGSIARRNHDQLN